MTVADRLAKYTERRADGCWEWRGILDRGGYARLNVTASGKSRLAVAHRLAYEITYGPIPTGMEVCHRCDNPRCVRPDHLFVGIHADNMADMVAKGRGHWARGEQTRAAKLTDARVRELRSRYAAGETQATLAVEFGVAQATVSRATAGLQWRHVA